MTSALYDIVIILCYFVTKVHDKFKSNPEMCIALFFASLSTVNLYTPKTCSTPH